MQSSQLVRHSRGCKVAIPRIGADATDSAKGERWTLCGRRRVWLCYVVRGARKKMVTSSYGMSAMFHGAMNVVTGLVPIHLSGCDPNTQTGATVAELNRQGLAFENNRNAMKRIRVPPRGLAGSEC